MAARPIQKNMQKTFLRIFLAASLVSAVGALPLSINAQTTNKATVEKKSAAKKDAPEKKQTAGPFRGKLATLDKSAKTFTVGKRTFHISSDTKILKHGKAATVEDGVVGEEVSGYFKTSDDGKLTATKVTFGPKVDTKTAAKQKEK
jgi:hypothetical protein